MVPPKYLGQIVKASVLSTVDDSFYKMRVLVRTGNLKGEKLFVAHRSSPDFLDQDILVRLSTPHKSTRLDFGDMLYSGNFITSEVPEDFDYIDSSEVILYAFWQDEMKRRGFPIPSVGTIADFYNPGPMTLVLHYGEEDGFVVPYALIAGSKELRKRTKMGNEGPMRGIGNALRNYLKCMGGEYSSSPKVVTIDEHIDFKNRILPEFGHEGVREKGIRHWIEMEAQQ